MATSWVPSTTCTCGAREGEWSKKNPNTLQFKLNNLNKTEENAPCGQKDSDYERDDDIMYRQILLQKITAMTVITTVMATMMSIRKFHVPAEEGELIRMP